MSDKSNDDLVMSTLMEIKEDIGGMHSDLRQIHSNMADNIRDHQAMNSHIDQWSTTMSLIPKSLDALKEIENRLEARVSRVEVDLASKFNKMDGDLSNRIGRLEMDVKGLREVDFPQLREQMVIHKWLASGRNKFLALLGVAVLGAAGNAVAGLVKDNVKITVDRHIDASITTFQHPVSTQTFDLDTMSGGLDDGVYTDAVPLP